MKPHFPYKRMPGTQRGLARRSTLWEGQDHLLLVRGTRFSEEYRRFYYRDIESVMVQKCARAGSIGWWILHAIAVFIVILLALTRRNGNWFTALAVVLVLLFLARIVVAFRYGCRCFIQTAVSREELPSLLHVWTAKRSLDRLRAKIIDAQGPLPEDIGPLLEQVDLPGLATPQAAAAQTQSSGNSPRSVNLAASVFVLLMVDAFVTLRGFDGPSTGIGRWAELENAILSLGIGGLAVWSLLSANARRLRNLRMLLIVTLIFEGAEIYLTTVLSRLYSLNKGVVSITMPSLRTWHLLVGLDGALCILLGVGGLLFLFLNWNYLRGGDTSPA